MTPIYSPNAAEQQAERAEARRENCEWATEHAADQIAYAVDVMFDALCSNGCMPFGFTGSKFRNDVCKRVGAAAVKAAIEESSANLPSGVVL